MGKAGVSVCGKGWSGEGLGGVEEARIVTTWKNEYKQASK
jgi:hypothetical protein